MLDHAIQTLGSWFRDYVYIPLGGNRSGGAKQMRNLAVVWLLTGFWHGASWNYVLWGCYFGVILIAEKLVLRRVLHGLPALLRHLYTWSLLGVSWALFGFEDLGRGLLWIGSMFGWNGTGLADGYTLYQLESCGPLLMLVPTAQEILSDKLPPHAPAVDQKQIEDRARSMGLPVVPAVEPLTAHREEPIYYRTDPHYTTLGAWHCYQAWRAFRGLEEADPEPWTKEVLTGDFLGTSWAKTGLPGVRADTITGWYIHPHRRVCYNGTEMAEDIFARDYLDSPEPYGVFLNSNQALTVIEGSGTAGKLLLIKDSFGNTFAQFPVEEYAQVHMIDLRFFREDILDYIRGQEITEVLVLYGTRNFATDRNWSW